MHVCICVYLSVGVCLWGVVCACVHVSLHTCMCVSMHVNVGLRMQGWGVHMYMPTCTDVLEDSGGQ